MHSQRRGAAQGLQRHHRGAPNLRQPPLVFATSLYNCQLLKLQAALAASNCWYIVAARYYTCYSCKLRASIVFVRAARRHLVFASCARSLFPFGAGVPCFGSPSCLGAACLCAAVAASRSAVRSTRTLSFYLPLVFTVGRGERRYRMIVCWVRSAWAAIPPAAPSRRRPRPPPTFLLQL